MPNYRVVKDGDEVFSVVTDSYEGVGPFGEYTERPESGRVELWIDDELVGVQLPYDKEAQDAALVEQLEAQLAAVRGEEA